MKKRKKKQNMDQGIKNRQLNFTRQESSGMNKQRTQHLEDLEDLEDYKKTSKSCQEQIMK